MDFVLVNELCSTVLSLSSSSDNFSSQYSELLEMSCCVWVMDMTVVELLVNILLILNVGWGI